MIVNGFKCFNERWYMNELQKISKKKQNTEITFGKGNRILKLGYHVI